MNVFVSKPVVGLSVVALRRDDVDFVGEAFAGQPADLGVVPALDRL